MIARYPQIKQQVERIHGELADGGHVQKIYSTAFYLCLQVRARGKNLFLYLGRGSGHEGIWCGDGVPPAFLRKRDRWLEWCRRHLTSAVLVGLEIDALDRIVRFVLRKQGQRYEFYTAWIGRRAYVSFFDAEKSSWFHFWRSGEDGAVSFAVFDEVGRREATGGSAGDLVGVGELLAAESRRARESAQPKKLKKSLTTKIRKIQEDLAVIGQWRQLEEWLQTQDPSTLEELQQFRLGELRYKLPPVSAWKKRDLLFGHLRRLKQAELSQQRRLAEAQAALAASEVDADAVENTLRVAEPVWRSEAAKRSEPQAQDAYEVQSFAGYKIGVGLTAQGNDQLRKSWAKAEDVWVHAASGTSAHAIIKLAAPGVVMAEHLTQAARLIARRSGIATGELVIIFTPVKNLRGVTGTPGMVTYKKTKTLVCDLREESP